MKRIATFIFLATALMLASCNIKIDVPDEDVQKSEPTAVGFGVYMNRGVTTKAGYVGELTTDILKEFAGGFGVFGYYGNGAMYNETMKPDFMYNQQVKYETPTGSTGVWTYSPIKYWPNEFGEAAGNEVADRLSFFAYAPYVAVTPSTGIVTGDDEDGILGMTRNISAGDPQVMYGARLQPGGGVDLCWGVAANNFTSSVDGNNNKIDKGKPYINLIKPKTGDKIAFEFNHALTQLNVQIDADIDVESHAASSLDGRTRVYVRSVSFTGFALRGSLNLNSEAGNPAWSDISGTGRLRREPVTIYDGRTDGLEGVESAVDVNETPAVLSPIIIQSKKFGQETSEESMGVTNTTVNLFANYDTTSDHSLPVANPDAPVMVIPIAGVPLTVTIVYDIETEDPNLAGFLSDGVTRGLSMENKITKSIQLSTGGNMTLESGKKYVIGLHLGLTSVKFDAQVADWDSNTYEGSAYLPANSSLTYINGEDSWNAAYNAPNSPLKAYYDNNPAEDLWSEREKDDPDPNVGRKATFNDKVYVGNLYSDAAGTTETATGHDFNAQWVNENVQQVTDQDDSQVYFMVINPKMDTVYELFTDNTLSTSAGKYVKFASYSYPGFVHCWKGAINADEAKFPWAVIGLPIPFVGNIELVYDDGISNPVTKHPWGENVRTFSKGYAIASVPGTFERTDWIINKTTGVAPADGTPAAFDPSKLVIKLISQ